MQQPIQNDRQLGTAQQQLTVCLVCVWVSVSWSEYLYLYVWQT